MLVLWTALWRDIQTRRRVLYGEWFQSIRLAQRDYQERGPSLGHYMLRLCSAGSEDIQYQFSSLKVKTAMSAIQITLHAARYITPVTVTATAVTGKGHCPRVKAMVSVNYEASKTHCPPWRSQQVLAEQCKRRHPPQDICLHVSLNLSQCIQFYEWFRCVWLFVTRNSWQLRRGHV